MIQIDPAIPCVDVELYKCLIHVFTTRKQLKQLERDNPSLQLELIKMIDEGAAICKSRLINWH